MLFTRCLHLLVFAFCMQLLYANLQDQVIDDYTTATKVNENICNSGSSIQGYLYCNLKDITCCADSFHADKALVGLINDIMKQCSSQLQNLAECAKETALEQLGFACACIDRQNVTNQIQSLIQKTKSASKKPLYYISMPLDPNHPGAIQPPISSPRQLLQTNTSVFNCKDGRQEGTLCSYWSAKYITAGNTVCRADYPCGTHGYSYNWCYTDHSNNWEYCCTGKCDYQGEHYRWCYTSPSKHWEYCGSYSEGKGLANVKNEECLDTYMCGKHGSYTYKYWCYTDVRRNWDYCCAPGMDCTKHSQSYLWCYSGEYNNRWDYCKTC